MGLFDFLFKDNKKNSSLFDEDYSDSLEENDFDYSSSKDNSFKDFDVDELFLLDELDEDFDNDID